MNKIWDMEAVIDGLKSADSEEEDGRIVRRTFLGTVFALTPSGKYYTPWACSNVDACPFCKGAGSKLAHKRRIVKRWEARNARRMRKIESMRMHGVPEPTVEAYYTRLRPMRTTITCEHCDGLGSMEAAEDARWTEEAEEELSKIGASLVSGDGDACDYFAEISFDSEEDEAEWIASH